MSPSSSAVVGAWTIALCSSAPQPFWNRVPDGIVYGRNVIQHAKPAGITAALMSVLHENASVEEALVRLSEPSRSTS